MSQDNSILTSIIFFSRSLLLYLSFLSSLQSSLSLSSTPLADSLTGSVPLADHSALIMRIISSHHSPWRASSISFGLFSRHQPLPIKPFICASVSVYVPSCVGHRRSCRMCLCISSYVHIVCLCVCVSVTVHNIFSVKGCVTVCAVG